MDRESKRRTKIGNGLLCHRKCLLRRRLLHVATAPCKVAQRTARSVVAHAFETGSARSCCNGRSYPSRAGWRSVSQNGTCRNFLNLRCLHVVDMVVSSEVLL